MNNGLTLEDLSTLAESVDLECKAAQGRNGRGEVPDDFWKSYSAMANGEGGVIWLGIQEKPRGVFQALGLLDVEKVRKALWDNLHNSKQISVNLLAENQVQPIVVESKTMLRVEVPRARRQARPVHLGSNPFGGTYLRRHEGATPALPSLLTPEPRPLTPEPSPLTPESSPLTLEPESSPLSATAPVISQLNQLSGPEIAILRQKAGPVSNRLRATPTLVRQTVLTLCDGRYLGLRVLADLLNRRDRDGKDLRIRILNPLVAEGALRRAYPKKNDPRQGYISTPAKNENA
jgi:hypothetical protein